MTLHLVDKSTTVLYCSVCAYRSGDKLINSYSVILKVFKRRHNVDSGSLGLKVVLNS